MAFICAPQEVGVQFFSPSCIAVAVVYLGLRVTGLAQYPTSTFWLVLAQRALHVDLCSARLCAAQLEHIARVHGVSYASRSRPPAIIPPVSVAADNSSAVGDLALGDVVSDAAVHRAAAALQGLPYNSAPLAPVSACSAAGNSVLLSHPRTFISCVLVEAAVAGAHPAELEVLTEAVAASMKQRHSRKTSSASATALADPGSASATAALSAATSPRSPAQAIARGGAKQALTTLSSSIVGSASAADRSHQGSRSGAANSIRSAGGPANPARVALVHSLSLQHSLSSHATETSAAAFPSSPVNTAATWGSQRVLPSP